jgi:hypothetical protein
MATQTVKDMKSVKQMPTWRGKGSSMARQTGMGTMSVKKTPTLMGKES